MRHIMTLRRAMLAVVLGLATMGPGRITAGSAPIPTEAGQVASRSAAEWLAQAQAARQAEPVDWVAVREAYEAAAALGSLPAMSQVGWIHEQGLGTPVDLVAAARWYAPVAKGGQDDFAIKLGWMYLQPELGPDRAQSEAWFQTAIARDSAAARVALASVLVADAQGGRDPARVTEAQALLETALRQGHPLASRFLARIHVEQIGGYASTPASRLHYTRLAAEDGQGLMQAWLAQRYLDGDGVPQNLLEAAFWAALAAANHEPLGQQLHVSLQSQLSEAQRRQVMERSIAWTLQRTGAGT